MAISHARISSSVGVFPKPNVVDCDRAIRARPSIIARAMTGRKNLRNSIAHAPVCCDFPWDDCVVCPRDAVVMVIIRRLFEDFGKLGPRRLNLTQFVRTTRLQFALFSVPLPVHAE